MLFRAELGVDAEMGLDCGPVRMGAMYFTYEKDIHLGVQRVENFGLNCVLPRFLC